LRHPVAVLRKELELSQQEFADVARCSRETIRSIEVLRLKLPPKLAEFIAGETGVSLKWLMANRPKARIVDARGRPYVKSLFKKKMASREDPLGEEEHGHMIIRLAIERLITRILSLFARAADDARIMRDPKRNKLVRLKAKLRLAVENAERNLQIAPSQKVLRAEHEAILKGSYLSDGLFLQPAADACWSALSALEMKGRQPKRR
jgi:transcriptional regulator with XRE-family HTH domain